MRKTFIENKSIVISSAKNDRLEYVREVVEMSINPYIDKKIDRDIKTTVEEIVNNTIINLGILKK